MIKKYWFELVLVAIFVLSMGIGEIIRNNGYSDEIKHLKNQVVEAYDKGYSDGENHAIIDFMEDYYEILIENAVLEEKIKWLSPSVIIHEFNPNYDFYLLVVVSREKTKTDFVWTYGLQMLDNNSDTAYIDSDKLFSIGEYVLAVEVNDNSVILIDLMEN